MIIQNNIMALSANRQLALNNLKLASSLQKLSSGYRINSAADDAAGLAISEKMRAQQAGLSRAMENAQAGVNLVNTAEGGLTEVHSMLNRLVDIAGQAANGTLQASQRQSLQKEANDILAEIDRISKATNYNGINLLDGSLSGGADVKGIQVDEAAPTAGHYDFAALPDLAGLAAGQEVSFSLTTGSGGPQTVSFTVNSDLAGMTAADGTSYAFATQPAPGATTADVSGADFAGALAAQLQKVGGDFSATANGAGLTLQNKETGFDTPRVTGLSYSVDGGAATGVAGTATTGTDTIRTLNRESFTVFNGGNESAAVFTANGEKFALVESGNFSATVAMMKDKSVNLISVSTSDPAQLTGGDLQNIAAAVNSKTGLALEANGNNGITVKGPLTGTGLTLQVGDTAAAYNKVNVKVGDMSVKGLGLEGLSFATQGDAASALGRIKEAIGKVSATRGDLGATSNRLSSTVRNLDTTYENITAAESRIRDADMAKTIMEYTKRNILSQASQAMLAQANMQSHQVLQLLK